MAQGGVLASLLDPIIGVGSNHGIGVLISVLGLLNVVVTLVAFANPGIRNVELDLPDHIASPEAEAARSLVEPAD
jgi:hypothetical protein